MNPKIIPGRRGPESIIQRDLILFLRHRGWFVKETHGNAFQSGFPDLFAAHLSYGSRWIECKNPISYVFTHAQLEMFPLMMAAGVGIWILTAATENEYRKLFKPANWFMYLDVMK